MERKYPRILFRKRLNHLREDVEEMGNTALEAYKKAMKTFTIMMRIW